MAKMPALIEPHWKKSRLGNNSVIKRDESGIYEALISMANERAAWVIVTIFFTALALRRQLC